ncbi:hypothetical protein [Deinococcus maricopensis]|uniref:Integral membrane protein n=1 Tax=Deinococcus maricopensis (strain DSM 21211 / LMG 22137 / NRRL B-23946 / LB-34) TaxID=709986 RepID=E8UBM2_DEIML|nr:hypothetical protein [Deinococcus maricopensis]ADV68461.1 integral membrane protein [Deinococcus maricopensis DSM 21211]
MGLMEAALFLALMVYMIVSQVGRRPWTTARAVRPMLIVAVLAAFTLHGVHLGGGNGLLAAWGVLLGAVFGVGAAACMRLEGPAGARVTVAGWPYALVWVVSMGGRVAFGLLAQGAWQDAVVQFSVAHGVTDAGAWRTAFLLMSVTEIVVRTLLVQRRAAPVRAWQHA